MLRGSRGSAPEGRKCSGEVVGALPKGKNAPGKPWERSRRQKMLRVKPWERSRRQKMLRVKPWERSQDPKMHQRSRGSALEGRKCSGEAVGVLPKAGNTPSEVVGALPKAGNASGKSWERSRSVKMRKDGIAHPREVRKRAGSRAASARVLLFAARALHAPLLIISYGTHPEQILQLCFRAVVNRVPVVV